MRQIERPAFNGQKICCLSVVTVYQSTVYAPTFVYVLKQISSSSFPWQMVLVHMGKVAGCWCGMGVWHPVVLARVDMPKVQHSSSSPSLRWINSTLLYKERMLAKKGYLLAWLASQLFFFFYLPLYLCTLLCFVCTALCCASPTMSYMLLHTSREVIKPGYKPQEPGKGAMCFGHLCLSFNTHFLYYTQFLLYLLLVQ